jgi:lactoylglutathione lyase
MLNLRRVDHLGLRITDRSRSLAFYQKLGFELVEEHEAGAVLILRNAAGIEVNFIVNGAALEGNKNVLMDVPEKHPGYTHVALGVDSIEEAIATLGKLGIELSGGPMKLGDGTSCFIRDPDANVIEVRQRDTSSPSAGAE